MLTKGQRAEWTPRNTPRAPFTLGIKCVSYKMGSEDSEIVERASGETYDPHDLPGLLYLVLLKTWLKFSGPRGETQSCNQWRAGALLTSTATRGRSALGSQVVSWLGWGLRDPSPGCGCCQQKSPQSLIMCLMGFILTPASTDKRDFLGSHKEIKINLFLKGCFFSFFLVQITCQVEKVEINCFLSNI